MEPDEPLWWTDEYAGDRTVAAPVPGPQRAVVAVGAALVAVALLAVAVALVRREDGGGRPDSVSDAAPAARAPVAGGRLLYGLAADPEGLDPSQLRWDESGLQVGNALYDPVTAFDAEGRPQPYLVESLTPGGDPTTWIFRLRPGVQFSTGEPLDAAAFVTFLQSLRRSAVAGSLGQLVTDVQALDDRQVRLTTAKPWATLPVQLAGQSGYVFSPRPVTVGPGLSAPAGTGPFLLRRWERGRRLELVRNARYWRPGLPRLDAVQLEVVADGAARVERVRRGELDVAPLTTPEDQKAFDATDALQASERRLAVERDADGGSTTAIVFNTDRAPFDDVRVRRAVAHATDIRAIASANGWPLERVARGPLAPGSPYFSEAPFVDHNLERARKLVLEYVADPGAGRGRAVTFALHATTADARFLNPLIEQWTRAGMRPSLVVDEPGELRRRVAQGDVEAVVLDDVATVDADQLWPYLVPEANPASGTFSFSRSGIPAITTGMDEGRASPDNGARRAAYARVQRALAEEVPFLWLLRPESRLAVSARVRDARNVTLPGAATAMPFVGGAHRLTETWISP